MGIKHEFRCLAHGLFESDVAVCPRGGCTTVEKVFITPRGIATGGSARIDATLRTLAGDFGLSNMKDGSLSRGDGTARVRDQRNTVGAGFGKMSKTIAATLAENRAAPGNTLADVKPHLPSLKRQVIATRDPDSDSRAKVMAQ